MNNDIFLFFYNQNKEWNKQFKYLLCENNLIIF